MFEIISGTKWLKRNQSYHKPCYATNSDTQVADMIVPVSIIYQANWLEYASVIEEDNPLQLAWDVSGQAVVSF